MQELPRTITHHHNSNDSLTIRADAPDASGASHVYIVEGVNEDGHPWFRRGGELDIEWQADKLLAFQKGPIKEVGVNGITNEAVLAILIDRLEGFQAGCYACRENGVALSHLRMALSVLHERTARRKAEGTEGTNQGN